MGFVWKHLFTCLHQRLELINAVLYYFLTYELVL